MKLPIIYQVEGKSIKEFVLFWSQLYHSPYEDSYKESIRKAHLDVEDIQQLFVWKNEGKINSAEQQSVDDNIKPKIELINKLKTQETIDIAQFNNSFSGLSAVCKLFLLHIIQPNTYPLYNEIIHRAFLFIQGHDYSNISNTTLTNEALSYHESYLKFVSNRQEINLKTWDEAFIAFGQFIDTHNYKQLLEINPMLVHTQHSTSENLSNEENNKRSFKVRLKSIFFPVTLFTVITSLSIIASIWVFINDLIAPDQGLKTGIVIGITQLNILLYIVDRLLLRKIKYRTLLIGEFLFVLLLIVFNSYLGRTTEINVQTGNKFVIILFDSKDIMKDDFEREGLFNKIYNSKSQKVLHVDSSLSSEKVMRVNPPKQWRRCFKREGEVEINGNNYEYRVLSDFNLKNKLDSLLEVHIY